ncbi:unnamed protein product [Oppiella nova]|uniref:Nanos-type domain-containing protein n=1 Tax=Oppiella nova TaxID=334625 RepID=A0A7R9QTS2_9ACAR|nr:unnamed protein product [Oppiella nova]CAG2175354.1 unnamed protein product [Oppiella nova]
MSPFGSPSKYSPLHWSLSRETFANTTVHSAPTLETISRSLFADNKDIIRIEFEANGKEVPIDVVSAGAAPPKHVIRYVSSAVNLVRSYEMFGKNGFTYAQLTAPVGQRLKETVAGDGNRSRNKRRIKTETHCKFCKNNNETPEMYNSHVCKDPNGVTVCPVLRNYDCPKCRSGGGDSAHTLRYCPLNKEGDKDYKPSVIKVLKNGRSADGKKRYIFFENENLM